MLTLERIKRIFINCLKKYETEGLGEKIIISGKNKSNKFVTYSIDSKNNYKEVYYEPTDNLFVTVYALPQTENENCNYQDFVDNIIKGSMPWENLNDLKEKVSECIIEVSKINSSVNDNIFTEVII